MSDIFISYASPDREIARTIAEAFAERGHSVWWDRTIPPGRVFDEVIQEALTAAKCVIVLWSSNSIRSNWVKTEASEALARNRLLPVLTEDVSPPIEFKRIQAANLIGWTGDTDHPEFRGLIASVERLLAQPHTTPPLPPPARNPTVQQQGTISISTRTATRAVAALVVIAALTASVLYLRSRGDNETDTGATQIATEPPAATAQQPSSPGQARSTPSDDRVNLLSPENGGEVLTAFDSSWTKTIDGDESSYGWVDFDKVGKSDATFGFKDGRAATFDTVSALVPSRNDRNVRQFELLAGNDGPLGEFRSVGVFTTQNILIMKSPFQAFTFAPVTAKAVKIRPLSTHGENNAMAIYEWQLLGKLN
jgi:hypothetical protein